MSNLFEIATRKKYRYPYKGSISTEDLWDLEIDQLNIVYMALNKTAETQEEKSLLSTPTVDENLQNKIDIVKYIFSVKQGEIIAQKEATEKKRKEQLILSLIEAKQNEKLRNMSEEELRTMLDNL
ncbi:MAG: hypothetical protein E7576_06975 [Ruminococcaceae bacterium]|nr:hypothetical protein [Oscillospiraceae bacterium]